MSNSAPDDQTPGDITNEQERLAAQQVLGELATSIVLLPQEATPDDQDLPESSIALPVIEQDGTQYLPVFTSEEGMAAAGADPATALRMPLAELSANWPGDDLWLAVDAGSENGLVLPPELAQTLAGFAAGAQQ